MNPWEWLWLAIGWVLAVLLLCIAVVVAGGIVWGLYTGVKGWFPSKDDPTPHKET